VIPQTTSAILATALFLLPGFIGQRYAEQTYSLRSEGSGFRGLALTLYYSLLSYIVLVTIAVLAGANRCDFDRWLQGNEQPKNYLLATLALIAISIALAELGRCWRRSGPVRRWILDKADIDERHTVVSGWEWFFNTGQKAFVIVTLKDDSKVTGYYGKQSYSGYTQDTPDLYLQERWLLDDNGWFKEPAAGTLGIYIRADEIKTVEFYELGNEEEPSTEAESQNVEPTEEHE